MDKQAEQLNEMVETLRILVKGTRGTANRNYREQRSACRKLLAILIQELTGSWFPTGASAYSR
jgi:hypothetical protein